MSHLGNFVLTGTAIAPVLLVYALMAALEGAYYPAAALVVASIVMVSLAELLLRRFRGNLGQFSFQFNSVEVADRETIGILVLYVLPLLRTSFVDIEWVVILPAAAIFIALAFTGHSYHFNPILILLRWRFYKVGTVEGVSYLLITKRELRNTNDAVTVSQLTNYTIIDVGN